MIAQAYYDNPNNIIVRVFKGNTAIADLPLHDATDEAADSALRAIRLRRCEPWSEGRCYWTAKVRWAGRRAK